MRRGLTSTVTLAHAPRVNKDYKASYCGHDKMHGVSPGGTKFGQGRIYKGAVSAQAPPLASYLQAMKTIAMSLMIFIKSGLDSSVLLKTTCNLLEAKAAFTLRRLAEKRFK